MEKTENTVSAAPIVVLSGPPRSGKSVVADHLIRSHGYTRHKIASPLKNMLRCLGLSEEHIEGSLKEVPSDLLGGKSPRWAMQTLGKDWRDLIHPDLWLIAWSNTRPDGPLVVDDHRYPNETPFFREHGATFLRVTRPGVSAPDTGHEAERHELPYDAALTNDGSIQDLETAVDACLRNLGVLP